MYPFEDTSDISLTYDMTVTVLTQVQVNFILSGWNSSFSTWKLHIWVLCFLQTLGLRASPENVPVEEQEQEPHRAVGIMPVQWPWLCLQMPHPIVCVYCNPCRITSSCTCKNPHIKSLLTTESTLWNIVWNPAWVSCPGNDECWWIIIIVNLLGSVVLLVCVADTN